MSSLPDRPQSDQPAPGQSPAWPFGAALDDLLRARGWSQAQLARAARIRSSTLTAYRHGTHAPRPVVLERILQALAEAARRELGDRERPA